MNICRTSAIINVVWYCLAKLNCRCFARWTWNIFFQNIHTYQQKSCFLIVTNTNHQVDFLYVSRAPLCEIMMDFNCLYKLRKTTAIDHRKIDDGLEYWYAITLTLSQCTMAGPVYTGMPLVDPVYTGIPLGHPANTCRIHWNTNGKKILKQPQIGMPQEKLSWIRPTLGCHWRNSNLCSLH